MASRRRDAEEATALHKQIGTFVTYAPWRVRVLSARSLGLGTMTSASLGLSANGSARSTSCRHGALLRSLSRQLPTGDAGIIRLPVSTTHVVTSGIAGTMVGSGAGLQGEVIWQIAGLGADAAGHDPMSGGLSLPLQ